MSLSRFLLVCVCCCIQCGAASNQPPQLYIKPDFYDALNPLALSPDGTQVLTVGSDYALRLWNVASGALERTYSGHTAPVTTLCFSHDGRFIASGGWDTVIRVWQVASSTTFRTFHGHEYSVESLRFGTDAGMLISAGVDGTKRIWSVDQETPVLTLMTLNDGGWLGYTADYQFHGSTGSDAFVRWRVQGDKVFRDDLNRQFHRPAAIAALMRAASSP